MFTNGDLKPSDDPEMVEPVKESVEQVVSTSNDKDKDKDKGKDKENKKGSIAGSIDNTVDEFKDKEGLHYKADLKATSKTPGPNMINTGSNNMMNRQQTNSIGDLHSRKNHNELSKMSLNFGGAGSRSNISSIVHLEEISQGYYSIDKQEYRLQQKVKKQQNANNVGVSAAVKNIGSRGQNKEIKLLTSRSLKDEPVTTMDNNNQLLEVQQTTGILENKRTTNPPNDNH